MQKYLVNTAGMDTKVASRVMTALLFCYMILQPAFGALADKIGRRNSMLCFGTFMVVTTVPILSALARVTDPYAAFGWALNTSRCGSNRMDSNRRSSGPSR